MRVYFDLENLISYVKSYSQPRFEECNIMLKKQVDISFNFTKDDLRGYLNDVDLQAWLTKMTEGIECSQDYENPEFPQRPLKSNTYKSFDKEQLSSVYLLNDVRMQMLIDGGNLLWAKVGDEVSVLSKLIVAEDGCGFDQPINARQLKNWNELDKYLTPNTDIILVDRYVTYDENLFDRNICSLLSTICGKRQAPAGPVNIVIFTQYADSGKGLPLDSPQWAKLYKKIKEAVSKQSEKKIETNVTFVLRRNLSEHDRTIITNYQIIESGPTFNYFGKNGDNVTNGRHLNIQSVARKSYRDRAEETLVDLQKIIDNVNRLNNPDLIKFDKKSNFLKF